VNRLLAVLLVLMGIGELIIAFAGVKPPLPVSLVLGALFIGMGIKNLLDAAKKTKA
jgi:hypothetical protein